MWQCDQTINVIYTILIRKHVFVHAKKKTDQCFSGHDEYLTQCFFIKNLCDFDKGYTELRPEQNFFNKFSIF